jgi:hypothetical protein
VLPGLGAFPIKPSENSDETKYLKAFLEDVLNHFLNRTSQRETIAYKASEIHKNINPTELKESLPEYIGNEKLLPDETFVLVGYYNDNEQYNWITHKKMYNFRMGSGKGSLVLDKETVGAKLLLLHTKGDKHATKLFRIVSKGPKVFSKQDLIKRAYANPSQDYYLVIEIDELNQVQLENIKYDFKKLANYKPSYASAKPFTTSLSELMRCKLD